MQNFMKTILNAVQSWAKDWTTKKIEESVAEVEESIVEVNDSVAEVNKKIDTAQVTADDARNIADIAKSTADTAKNTANNKMNASNPVGTGSFSMNRKSGTTVGDYSHAEGYYTTASGYASHAEGHYTTASGYASHAEGCYTTASGKYSHAEGYNTQASCGYSHAEGMYAIASGDYSHAEGYKTRAFGDYSHAEGYNTIASGGYSHAEGYRTKASGNYQHVQGRFNIEDAKSKYAHIVGNGTSTITQAGESIIGSNAHTLDWNGVGWYQGGLQVGGNAQDDGAKNVLLDGDAIPVPETAQVGQFLAVKAVDENGKPIEWGTVTLSLATDENGVMTIVAT